MTDGRDVFRLEIAILKQSSKFERDPITNMMISPPPSPSNNRALRCRDVYFQGETRICAASNDRVEEYEMKLEGFEN